MPSQSRTRFFGMLHGLAVAFLWSHALFPAASAKVVDYLEQGFLFDWYGDQSPPVPTAAQCDTLHITWGRRTATGPNPAAPYYLQIYTSSFIVPFVIPAGDNLATSFDWVVPFVPGTLFQMCMVASNGVTGGCQNIYTVYQRPNTTLDNPPTCFNLTYPHAPLGVQASLADGSWSQYGWIDQCTDISLKPTNGTPPFTYTIAPALHPPFNITSDTTDAVNWTVSLMYGLPFFVTVTDSDGIGWTNGPLHPTGAGSTSCLDLDAALNPQPTSHSKGISAGGAIGIAIGTLVLGALIGLLGSFFLARWKYQRRTPPRPLYAQKLTDPGDTPTLSLHPPLSSASTTFGTAATSPMQAHLAADEHGLMSGGSPGTPSQSATFSHMQSRSLSGSSDRGDAPPGSPTHQHTQSTGSSGFSPTSPNASSQRSPLGGLPTGSGSHVYVVHHDAGRPPPVTVFTSDGTEVVELPPQYETAAARERREEQEQGRAREQGQGQGAVRALPPLSPPPPPPAGGQQRRAPRALPTKPTMVASNADLPAEPQGRS
ncbi:hypothetical protein C2E23DRAFT_898548 [Lenzites betulinus]|nr:hypothetical protein C2E23DRAFT_898548 [Lenzites betulinus]